MSDLDKMVKDLGLFKVKEEHVVEGITSDYVWYNSEILTQKMSSWANEFKRVVKVMENRHEEHLEIIKQLIEENHELKRKAKKDD
jgi:hypothetical protein